jgi:hypothetical protein
MVGAVRIEFTRRFYREGRSPAGCDTYGPDRRYSEHQRLRKWTHRIFPGIRKWTTNRYEAILGTGERLEVGARIIEFSK